MILPFQRLEMCQAFLFPICILVNDIQSDSFPESVHKVSSEASLMQGLSNPAKAIEVTENAWTEPGEEPHSYQKL